MNGISCPRCGAANPPNAAFCGTCGTPLAQPQPPASPEPPQSPGWQPPAANQPPAGGYPPPGTPPPVGYPGSPQGGYGFPPQYPGQKVTGDNTKWALGLGIASVLCCGPFTAVPGIFMAKKDMDEIASGRAPHLNEGMAKGAYYLNIAGIVLFVVGLCFWWGMGGMRRF